MGIWRGGAASPFEPPPPRAYVRLAGERAASLPLHATEPCPLDRDARASAARAGHRRGDRAPRAPARRAQGAVLLRSMPGRVAERNLRRIASRRRHRLDLVGGAEPPPAADRKPSATPTDAGRSGSCPVSGSPYRPVCPFGVAAPTRSRWRSRTTPSAGALSRYGDPLLRFGPAARIGPHRSPRL